MESALPFVVLLKGVVVRVEGLKMSPSGRLVDYAALNDGTRGMVPQDQLVVHRENMTKEHLFCMSYVCLVTMRRSLCSLTFFYVKNMAHFVEN